MSKCRNPKIVPAPKKHFRDKTALHLIKGDGGRVELYISVGDGHNNPCGTPGKDWKYCSPRSVLLDCEGRRSGTTVALMIDKAESLSDMLGIPIVDEIFGIPIDWKPRSKR